MQDRFGENSLRPFSMVPNQVAIPIEELAILAHVPSLWLIAATPVAGNVALQRARLFAIHCKSIVRAPSGVHCRYSLLHATRYYFFQGRQSCGIGRP